MPDNTSKDSYMRFNYVDGATTNADIFSLSGWGDCAILHDMQVSHDLSVLNQLSVSSDAFIFGHLYLFEGTGTLQLTFDTYNDIDLLYKWRNNEELPFKREDVSSKINLLRDSIVQLNERVVLLEKGKNDVSI